MSESFRQSTFGLWTRYIRVLALSQLQYRGWIVGLLPALVYTVTDPLDALLLFDRFGSLGEWTASRVMLVYGMALLCFGLAELFARVLETAGVFKWDDAGRAAVARFAACVNERM